MPNEPCLACQRAFDNDILFCEACREEVAQELTQVLRAVAAETGCIRCCQECPTCEGLFCQACYAEILIEESV
jgi:hypothetical protein